MVRQVALKKNQALGEFTIAAVQNGALRCGFLGKLAGSLAGRSGFKRIDLVVQMDQPSGRGQKSQQDSPAFDTAGARAIFLAQVPVQV